MQRIYVSGSKGFIGSALKEKFIKDGHEVIDRSYPLYAIKRLKDHDIDTVVHCAARVGTVPCDQNPGVAAQTNIKGTWDIAKIAKEIGAYFVNVSSVSIYDFPNEHNVITEDSKINPHTWYGMTKYLSEKAAECVFGNDFLNLRLGFIYGAPDKDPHSVVSGFIKDIEVPLVGEYEKDYLYIDDCVEAMARLVYFRETGTFNIGSGTIKPVVDILVDLEATKFKFDNEGDYYKSFVIRTDKVEKTTGWLPRTPFLQKIKELKEEYVNKG